MYLWCLICIDVGLAQVEIEKKLALIKAWEENEKTKADNKYSFFFSNYFLDVRLIFEK